MAIERLIAEGYSVISKGENYTHLRIANGNNYLFRAEIEDRKEIIIPFKIKYTYNEKQDG